MNLQPLKNLLEESAINSGSLCTGITGSLSNEMGGSLCPEFAYNT